MPGVQEARRRRAPIVDQADSPSPQNALGFLDESCFRARSPTTVTHKARLLAVISALVMIAACGRRAEPETTPEETPAAAPDAGALLDAAIASDIRTAEEKARDVWRHPKETLEFFGVEPSMTVVEVWPGGGWYARILAPYLKSGGGVYLAAHFDPGSGARAAAAVDQFKADFSDTKVFGDVRIGALGAGPIAPPESADIVLTFRNVHNWLASGDAEAHFRAYYAALKPGGVLGVVEHRANEDADERDGATGYVKESTVKALAEAAGFVFEASSEINANPRDTKDHPLGVWMLPPVRRMAAARGQEDPAADRAKYEAIGESDRMTLKFRKPRDD
jgi:predicted methyltransferase